MTIEERKAFEYGKTYFCDGDESKNAPCYDDRMKTMVIEARSKQGRDYNTRIICAWWAGRSAAGSCVPELITELLSIL